MGSNVKSAGLQRIATLLAMAMAMVVLLGNSEASASASASSALTTTNSSGTLHCGGFMEECLDTDDANYDHLSFADAKVTFINIANAAAQRRY
ncbi:hypothetical protein V6N13_052392 [Hibiscus sabdariffa]|uniref:Uncharacterized protein n=2 Tax=Hibiscus sabdariffa TaxID=183260 RepID=A0ABR2A7B1_9ROSI